MVVEYDVINKPSQAVGNCLGRHQVDNALVIKVTKKLSFFVSTAFIDKGSAVCISSLLLLHDI